MRNRSRILAVALMVVAISALSVLIYNPFAKADPTGLAIQGNNGYRTLRVTHPTHENWYVDLAVDTQQGFQPSTNRSFNSGVARISKGPVGVVRVQVDAIRVGYGNFLLNDYYPSKFFDPRNNTPPGCAQFDSPNVLSLYADFSVAPGCQPVGNPLNSAGDYEPDVSLVRGYSDWSPPLPCTDVSVATRGFFAVRWADNSYSQFSLRTGTVDANPDCSP